MRKWLPAVIVVVILLVGYLLPPRTVGAQQASLPFLAGQRLMLTFEAGRNSQPCTVVMVQGDFLGCTRERSIGSEEREIWYNLRFVERVEKRDR